MNEVLNSIIDILEGKDTKDNYNYACHIYDTIEECKELKDLFESIDVNIDDEDEYIDYLSHNIDKILAEMEDYLHFRLTDIHETGGKFEREIHIDHNFYYASDDDLLGNDYLDIDKYEESLYTEQHGAYLLGTRPSKKKDRSKTKYRPEELEW